MKHSGEIQQCPPWTRGLKLQEDSRAHLWSEFSSAWATSCGIDLHDVVIVGGQHQDLLHVAVVEHLSRAKWVQPRHGYPLLLMLAAAHRVHAAPAANACRVHLVVQQGQAVILHAAVWGHWAEVSVSSFICCWNAIPIPPPPLKKKASKLQLPGGAYQGLADYRPLQCGAGTSEHWSWGRGGVRQTEASPQSAAFD